MKIGTIITLLLAVLLAPAAVNVLTQTIMPEPWSTIALVLNIILSMMWGAWCTLCVMYVVENTRRNRW